MTLENAIERLTVPMTSYIAFATLELIALARYTDTPGLSNVGATVLAGFLAAMLVIGAYGVIAAQPSTVTGTRAPAAVERWSRRGRRDSRPHKPL
jgi:hypothetical protein